jgi:hypothetical protein
MAAPFSTLQQYWVQIYRNLLLFCPGFSAGETSCIIKPQSIYSAISKAQPISALFLIVSVANGLFKYMQMRIEEEIWAPDAQQLAISPGCMEAQLLENHANNLLWLSQQLKRNIWPQPMLLGRLPGYKYS